MSTYIVFSINSPVVDGPLPDPLSTWAVITQKETEQEAVDFAVKTGALTAAAGEVHACDLTATQSFKVTTEVSLETSDGSSLPSQPPPAESPAPIGPTALFTFTPSSPNRNDLVHFDASQSTVGTEPIVRYDWQFGDVAEPDAGAAPTFQFTRNGDYDVILTVTDEAELTSESTQTISI